MKKILFLLAMASTLVSARAHAEAPVIDLCGEKVDYRLVEEMGATLTIFIRDLTLDNVNQSTVCVENEKIYVIYTYKQTRFYAWINPHEGR